jgi:hypothetical protein
VSQFETDRENQAVGPDFATDEQIERLEQLIQADRDRRFQSLLEAEAERQQKADELIKQNIHSALSTLSICGNSFITQRRVRL